MPLHHERSAFFGARALPILPLRNSVVFPASVVPINVGRPRSVRLVEDLAGHERAVVGIVSQRDAEVDEPGFEDLYEVGTVARVVKVHSPRAEQLLGRPPRPRALPDRRSRRRSSRTCAPACGASPKTSSATSSSTRSARSLREGMREVLALMPNLPRETAGILDNVRESGALADLIASNLTPEQATVADKQKILETFDAEGARPRRARHRAAGSSSSSA